ncbi:S41 family peptidase [Rhodanobacter umsongensis]|uniref:S41 family peptidase n=1 Tax=Rhodanobacter umsongensis TaxID=633153 RepID=A0ABW0JH45_9GAMM
MQAKIRTIAALCVLNVLGSVRAAKVDDGTQLRMQVTRSYPSLRYVERYRHDFPDEVQGHPFWSADHAAPSLSDASALTRALAALQDQHVALVGASAGKSETLGVLFRTASDGSVIVWRVFDAAAGNAQVGEGDRVLTIDGQDARAWMQRAATLTFGGQRRGRYAEAATELGLATPVVHRVAGLGSTVAMRLHGARGQTKAVTLSYKPMDAELARSMTAAINRADLPRHFMAAGLRIGTLRMGAFAPQYDDAFVAAADAASKRPGASDDAAMLAGYCAVARNVIRDADTAARDADVLVLDLRGNLGGFDREAWLLADALGTRPSLATYDLFAGTQAGTVRLAKEPTDPSCGHVTTRAPLVVLTDAGTRSAGEFMASWLWASGATVVGEPTVGAGGGFEFNGEPGTPLPGSGYAVRLSGNFSVFDPAGTLAEGEHAEGALVDMLAQDHFAPSRTRPFAIQSVGLRPDVALSTTLADLQDGGLSSLVKALAKMKADRRL